MTVVTVNSPPMNVVVIPPASSPGTGTSTPIRVQPSAAPDQIEVYTFSYGGNLAQYTGQGRLYLDVPCEIRSVRFALGTPAGGATTVDMKVNGFSIFPAPPVIPSGEHTIVNTNLFMVTTLVRGDYLTVDIVNVDLNLPGSDLTVILRVKRLA